MCSIAGTVQFRMVAPGERAFQRKALEDALVRLWHRGPDQAFVTEAGSVCTIAGNRLIVRGGPAAGRQPFVDGRRVACFNGEIYNYRTFTDKPSDGYAILEAYLRNGLDFPNHLDGEFALCLWDDVDGILILARDHFGTKPLFFGFDEDRLFWSSSACLVADFFERPLCPSKRGPAYRHTYAIQEPYTSYQGVWSIPPGHQLVFERGCLTLRPLRGWPCPVPDWKLDVRSALWDALHARLDCNDTLAIPLSAGIDSGILAFAADRLGVRYHTYSVVSVLGVETIEAPYIRERLARLNPDSATLLDCTREDYCGALRAMFLDSYHDSEYLDNGAILTHRVASAVKQQGHTVLLDGAGGDELFNGYQFRHELACPAGWPPPPYDHLASLYTTLPAYVAKVDRAGAYHSLETRFPFLAKRLLCAAVQTGPHYAKNVLRDFLLNELDYGPPLDPDLDGKYGFSMRGHDVARVRRDLRSSWLASVEGRPRGRRARFPFPIGRRGEVRVGAGSGARG